MVAARVCGCFWACRQTRKGGWTSRWPPWRMTLCLSPTSKAGLSTLYPPGTTLSVLMVRMSVCLPPCLSAWPFSVLSVYIYLSCESVCLFVSALSNWPHSCNCLCLECMFVTVRLWLCPWLYMSVSDNICLWFSVSVTVFFCLGKCLSPWLSVYATVFVRLWECMSVSVIVCLCDCIFLSLRMSVSVIVCRCDCMSVSVSVCICGCMSASLDTYLCDCMLLWSLFIYVSLLSFLLARLECLHKAI